MWSPWQRGMRPPPPAAEPGRAEGTPRTPGPPGDPPGDPPGGLPSGDGGGRVGEGRPPPPVAAWREERPAAGARQPSGAFVSSRAVVARLSRAVPEGPSNPRFSSGKGDAVPRAVPWVARGWQPRRIHPLALEPGLFASRRAPRSVRFQLRELPQAFLLPTHTGTLWCGRLLRWPARREEGEERHQL